MNLGQKTVNAPELHPKRKRPTAMMYMLSIRQRPLPIHTRTLVSKIIFCLPYWAKPPAPKAEIIAPRLVIVVKMVYHSSKKKVKVKGSLLY